ncbi:MAG TPA: CocE/NonD family hydrolase [Jatrophihabitans sp.]|nr:CocE/NonD family hydrolase [Jatrophihabitans sp.]
MQEAIAASAAPGHSWTVPAPRYGVARQNDVAVRMADGTVLRADIATPTDPATNQPAPGPFPVLLIQTPYGKDTAGAAGSSAIGIDPYFVTRGYIDVAVDVRGTGDSGGRFDIFDPKQVADGVALVHWAAKLPYSSGQVGLHGASYLGIDQMLTAGAIGKNSPLKAIFPVVSATDVYRDTAFMGGIPDVEFDTIYLAGLLPVLNLLNPAVGALVDPSNAPAALQVLLQHAANTLNYNALFLLQAFMGGANSYDNAYWRAKAPGNVLSKIVANDIPAYLVGGEYDLFQRGEPLNYAGLQNAYAGRPVNAPMSPGQKPTGRYQLLDGPYTHLQIALVGSLDALELEWFDTWLKGADTGMAQTPTPLHYYDLGTGHYAQTTTYPIAGAKPTVYYFRGARSGTAPSRNDGTLSPTAPSAATGSDGLAWLPVGPSICDRSVDQWAAGALSLVTEQLPTATPCVDDDRAGQLGPTALTYTTAAMMRAKTLAGPIAATIYAKANTKDSEWVVNVEDVAPDGTSKPLTQGALLGSMRALDPARTWTVGGRTVIPYHPYTQSAARAVTPGALTRYDIEVFPTYSTIAAGHRIRVTVTTTDFPHLAPTPPQLAKLVGGRYQVQRTVTAPSSITLPLIG